MTAAAGRPVALASAHATLDRKRARAVLGSTPTGRTADEAWERWIDALAECVVPAPPQTIDRAAFLALLKEIEDGDGLFDVDELYQGLLALLRPVEGVVLNREEAKAAISGLRWAALHPTDGAPATWGSAWIALAARLEAHGG